MGSAGIPQPGTPTSGAEPRPAGGERQKPPPRARPVCPQAAPGAEPALLGPHPVDRVHRAAAGARVDPVEAGGVQTEDAPLGARRERRIPELLLHHGRDGEGLVTGSTAASPHWSRPWTWFRTMNAVAVPAAVRRNSPRVRPRRRARRATSSSRRRAARRCFADAGRGHPPPFETSANGKAN